ncbi:ABC transporter permease [Nitratireductor sp. StC3]|uniref:ABC transporter permease n=1 Tax=Nitratireductor sp. StC3 TaxID=2126741 RepID=UPI000D0D12F3|nr:ABC transporter permease [Nitratireductor sp. StC3]PSM15846.1 ABC transporter permease [Nitratireductor sp. StC3]
MSIISTRNTLPSRLRELRSIEPIYFILLAIVVAMVLSNPIYLDYGPMMQLLRRSSPLIVLAIGQLFVIISGGFDLSVGSLMTFLILVCALLLNSSPELAYPAIALCLVVGLASGAVNGLVVSFWKVPSIIATLGMLLMLRGAGFYLSGGSARGNLPDTFRAFGRDSMFGFPLALIVVIVFGTAAWLILHRTSFGRQLYMVGANPLAARLSGVNVAGIRIAAFMLSGLSAAIAAILLSGFSGVSTSAGNGYELQAISAAVLGGAVLLGGRGSVVPVIAGALALHALFTLLNIWGFPKPMRDVVQGLIIICAVAYSARRK